jgi:hypothetical protein
LWANAECFRAAPLTLANSSAVMAHFVLACCTTGRSVLAPKSHSSSRPPAVTAPNTVLLEGHHCTSSTSSLLLWKLSSCCWRPSCGAVGAVQLVRYNRKVGETVCRGVVRLQCRAACCTPVMLTGLSGAHMLPACYTELCMSMRRTNTSLCTSVLCFCVADRGPCAPATCGWSSHRCMTGTGWVQRATTAAHTRALCGHYMTPGTARCSWCCTCVCGRPQFLRVTNAADVSDTRLVFLRHKCLSLHIA